LLLGVACTVRARLFVLVLGLWLLIIVTICGVTFKGWKSLYTILDFGCSRLSYNICRSHRIDRWLICHDCRFLDIICSIWGSSAFIYNRLQTLRLRLNLSLIYILFLILSLPNTLRRHPLAVCYGSSIWMLPWDSWDAWLSCVLLERTSTRALHFESLSYVFTSGRKKSRSSRPRVRTANQAATLLLWKHRWIVFDSSLDFLEVFFKCLC
jgi:hypothetical protein